MNDTWQQAPKLGEFVRLKKLSRMLRSTLRKWPRLRVMRQSGAFGAYLDAATYLRVSFSGDLTREDISDLLTLCTVWWRSDEDFLDVRSGLQGGSSATDDAPPQQSSGPTSTTWHRLGSSECRCRDSNEHIRVMVDLRNAALSRSPEAEPRIRG